MGPPDFQEVITALGAADLAQEETVACVGTRLIWCIRRRTRHPRLVDTFPDGFFLVTECDLMERGHSLQEEIDSCRVALPPLSGIAGELGHLDSCVAPRVGAIVPMSSSTDFEHAILEERLEPLSITVGRQLLSEVSRRKLHLSMPLLVAVEDELSLGEQTQELVVTPGVDGLLGCRTAYLGVRTKKGQNQENEAPDVKGPHILETIRVSRPFLTPGATIGDALLHCRGCSTCAEVRLRARYDLSVASERPGSAWEADLPADLIPGPFISLVISWPMPMRHAALAPLLQSPSALSCSAAVYMRCGDTAETSLLGRYFTDLDMMRRLTRVNACTETLLCAERASELCSKEAVVDAVARFFQEEKRLSTSSGALAGHGIGSNSRTAEVALRSLHPEAGDEERPGRDFVDRRWIDVV